MEGLTTKGLIILVAIITISSARNESNFPEKLSTGVSFRKLEAVRVYETFSALTFDFELPAYPNNNTIVFDYQCPDAKYKTNYSCPIYYHLHKIRDELKPYLELHHLRHPEATTPEFSYTIPSCNEILTHFRATTITPDKLREYQQQLRTCVSGLLVKTPLISRYNQLTPRSSYQDLVRGFIENYYTMLPSSNNRIDKAILLNTLTSTNVLGLVQMLEEAQMWTEVMSNCKASTIPGHLISSDKLRSYLDYLLPKLRAKNLELAIPLEDISVYYKAPLADCVMTRAQLFVRLLIPVKTRASSWSLYSLASIPFVYNDGEDAESQLICSVKSINQAQVYSFDSHSKLSFPVSPSTCDPQQSILCHNGEDDASINQFKKSCASEIFSGQKDRNQILKSCDLHCEPIESFRTPILYRSAPDKFYLAGRTNETAQVQCQNISKTVSPPKEGALEIQLPCQCTILLGGGAKRFMTQQPCHQNVTIYNIKPLHLAPIVTEPKRAITSTTTPRTTTRDPFGFEDSAEFLPEKYRNSRQFDW